MSTGVNNAANEAHFWRSKCVELEGKVAELGGLEQKLFSLVDEIERLSGIVQEYERWKSNLSHHNISPNSDSLNQQLLEERQRNGVLAETINRLEKEKFQFSGIAAQNEKDILLMKSELFRMKQGTSLLPDSRVSQLMQENQRLAELLQNNYHDQSANFQSNIFNDSMRKDSESLMKSITKLSKENLELKQSKIEIEKKAFQAIKEMEEMQKLLKEQSIQIEQLRGNLQTTRQSNFHGNGPLVDSLQTRIQELNFRCQNLQEKAEENDDLSSLILDYENKIAKLIEDNEKLADLIVEKNEKLKDIDLFLEEKNIVEDKIHDYEIKLKELLESYDKLAQENELMKEGKCNETYYKLEYAKMERKCQEYKCEIEDLSNKFNEYKNCVDSFEKAQEKMENDRDNYEIKTTKLQINLNGLEQENFLLKKEIERLKKNSVQPQQLSEVSNTNEQFEKSTYENQIKQLKEMNCNSKAEMQNLYELLRVRKADSEEKSKIITKHQNQITMLTKDLSNSISINEELQARLKRLSVEYEKINKKNALERSKENSISFESKEGVFDNIKKSTLQVQVQETI